MVDPLHRAAAVVRRFRIHPEGVKVL
jgi:hypothetical protein